MYEEVTRFNDADSIVVADDDDADVVVDDDDDDEVEEEEEEEEEMLLGNGVGFSVTTEEAIGIIFAYLFRDFVSFD